MTSITEEEAKFAPVSLLDELGTEEWWVDWLRDTVAINCAECLWLSGCSWKSEHCVGERTDFDA